MKGASWAARLPVVHMPQRAAAKPVTLVMPYYENPRFVRRQIDGWQLFPPDLRAYFSVILVDDGSPTAPLTQAIAGMSVGHPLRTFRIDVDVRWNWIAARNIGAHEAPEGWLLLTDMDHVLPEATLRRVVYGVHDPAVIYVFSRQDQAGARLAPHPNSWLMTRAMFWAIGGYDEHLSGYYGTDGDYRRRCAATAPMQVLTDVLVRHEHEDDASTSRYGRKEPRDARGHQLMRARPATWQPKVLSFPYREVTA
jgi:hypothetical protein